MMRVAVRRNRRQGTLAVLGMLLALPGCAAPTAEPPAISVEQPALRLASTPNWRPGDQWVYAWTSGTESATRTVEVLEIRSINDVSFYIVRTGDAEHFWTRDLAWAGHMRDRKIEARMTPPAPLFAWPLEPGRRWDHRGVYEDRSGKRQVNDSFQVVGVEIVEVPAGRFSAFKIVRETDTRDSDQYWYAPEVGFYVRWIGRRGDVQFEEQLREYRPAPRLIRDSAPPNRPSRDR